MNVYKGMKNDNSSLVCPTCGGRVLTESLHREGGKVEFIRWCAYRKCFTETGEKRR